MSQGFGIFAGDGQDRDAVELPAVDVAEAADLGVAVEIAVHPVVARAGVGAEVDHAERPAGRGEIEPAALVGIDPRLDVVGRRFGRLGSRGGQSRGGRNQRNDR